MASSLGLQPAARRQRHRRIIAPQTAGVDVKLPFAMAGPKTSAGKGVFQMAKVVADILRLVAKLRPPPVTSTA